MGERGALMVRIIAKEENIKKKCNCLFSIKVLQKIIITQAGKN